MAVVKASGASAGAPGYGVWSPEGSNKGVPAQAQDRGSRLFVGMSNTTRTNDPHRISSSVIDVASDARRLRESLSQMSVLWRQLESGTARRARFLVSDVVSRIADPRRGPRGPIRVRLEVFAAFVRIEISGPGVLSPPLEGSTIEDLWFPIWIIEDLAERWGGGPGGDSIWFEIDRGCRD
jgi:hypothetical protein